MQEHLEQLWYTEAPSRWSPLLLAASKVFGAIIRVRNRLYDWRLLRAHRITGAKVVSVGNINVGGSGKTPAIIHLARRALDRGLCVAVLTRGYGRRTRTPRVLDASAAQTIEHTNDHDARVYGDEPLMIAARCPNVRVYIGADRVALAQTARADGAELILLDDGFQHRRLARDLDIVVLDQAAGVGNGHLLPRGPLREPVGALSRAHLVWLNTTDAPNAATPLPAWSGPIVRVRSRVSALLDPDGQPHAPDAIAGRSVALLAGIARPERFERTIRALGLTIAVRHFFSDHHLYTAEELEQVRASARDHLLITTEKDRVRLPRNFPTWVVRLDVELVDGEDVLSKLGL